MKMFWLLCLGFVGCCPSGQTKTDGDFNPAPSAAPAPSSTYEPSDTPKEAPVPVVLPMRGLICAPAVVEEGWCPAVVPPETTPRQIVDVARWLRATRSVKMFWRIYDNEKRVNEVEAFKESGKDMPKDLKKWAEDHEVASVTTWKTPSDDKPLWRVNWNFGTMAGDGPRETIIGPGRFPRIPPLPSALYPASKIPMPK